MDDQQKRLFMALVLCAGAAVLWQMFLYKPPLPPAAEGTGAVAVEATEAAEPAPAPAPAVAEGTGEDLVEPSMAAEQPVESIAVLPPQILQGRDFEADFTNRGAALDRVQIEAPEQYIPRDEFGVFPHGETTHPSLRVTLGGVPALTETSVFELVEAESEHLDSADPDSRYRRLVYRWRGDGLEVDKVFSADAERSYVTDMQVVIRDVSGSGREIDDVEVHVWTDASNAETRGMLNPGANTMGAGCYVDEGLESESFKEIADQRYVGPTRWAGTQDRYFLTAVAVPGEATAAGCRFARDEEYISSVLVLEGRLLGPNEETSIDLLAFTGPKAAEALGAVGSRLERAVNYGIFGFLAKPLRWILTTFYSFIPNWGIAIILLTVVVKLALFPWTQKSFKSMERMREIQPKLVELREKHKNDKQKLTEETMKLYREHNVNPLGCLPMLLQMPIYIALYRTIYSSVELYKADFALWINDLSQADPYYILPVLMTATMFGQQLLMPSSVDNPQMKWVMRLMPVMFGVFMLVLPSGLVLYIFVSSLLGIIQQWLIRRQRSQKEDPAPSPSGQKTRQQRRQAARRQRS